MIDAQLKAAILKSELTPYAIAKAAGCAPGMLTRYILGQRDLRLNTAAKVAHTLGLELCRPRSAKSNGKPSPRRKG